MSKQVKQGTFSQASERIVNPGIQCSMICLSAFIQNQSLEVQHWQTCNIDQVLCNGDELFNAYNLSHNRKPSRLMATELPKTVETSSGSIHFISIYDEDAIYGL